MKMGFAAVKDADELLDMICNIKARVAANSRAIIKDNKYYIPSVRTSFENNDRLALHANESWLKSAFTMTVLYWKDFNLVGIMSPMDIDELSYIEFQNSCDQDYEFNHWPHIKFFEDIVEQHKNLNPDELTVLAEKYNYNMDDCDIEDEQDMENEYSYMCRTFAYKSVFSQLGFDEFIYEHGENPPFKKFKIACIESNSEIFRLSEFCKTLS